MGGMAPTFARPRTSAATSLRSWLPLSTLKCSILASLQNPVELLRTVEVPIESGSGLAHAQTFWPKFNIRSEPAELDVRVRNATPVHAVSIASSIICQA